MLSKSKKHVALMGCVGCAIVAGLALYQIHNYTTPDLAGWSTESLQNECARVNNRMNEANRFAVLVHGERYDKVWHELRYRADGPFAMLNDPTRERGDDARYAGAGHVYVGDEAVEDVDAATGPEGEDPVWQTARADGEAQNTPDQ